MRHVLKFSKFGLLVMCGLCLATSQADAGWRRWANCDSGYGYGYGAGTYGAYNTYGSNYGSYGYSSGYYPSSNTYSNTAPAAPAVVHSQGTVTSGRQQYQSAYQAPVTTPAAPVYTAPAYTGPAYAPQSNGYISGAGNMVIPRTTNQFDPTASRKILDGRMQH